MSNFVYFMGEKSLVDNCK